MTMKDLKPALRFLGIFVGLYLGLNILYGFWISSYGNQVDSATKLVTTQTSFLLNLFGEGTFTKEKMTEPSISVANSSGIVMNVFEGCNGINVMVVFASFLFAFGGRLKKLVLFLMGGLLVIYVANLGRVFMLYYVAEYWNDYFYYIHKYVLTAFLYVITFALWWIWIEKFNGVSLKNVVTSK